MPSSGETWNQFKLLEPLGRGGMGEVFLAEDESLDRKVALKFLPEPLQKDDTARERFLREAKSAAALDHPYICKIYEIGEVEGKAFIAMEYVQGVTVQEKLRGGPLPLPDLLNVGIEICEAVEAAHNKQIIHRDLKTANIMLTTDGHVKVMDFGLARQVALEEGLESKVDTLSAKLTEHGATPGTVVYMSPEQVRGEPLDTRSDVFSLGVVLYELATGIVPFQGATSGLTYDAILNRGPKPPSKLNRDVPPELEQIIEKALEKDRENRYQSIRELIVDLKRLRRDSDIGSLPLEESGVERAQRVTAKRKSPWRWITAAALVALVVAAWLVMRPGASDVAGGAPIGSLAVLPFENPRNDPEVDYLADGIAENLINRLSELPQLSVMARSTAFRYRGTNVDPQMVGNELDVGAVLTGRVVQQGETLNVQAELVDTEKGTQLWGQQYERELDDLLTVQNDLATEITQALRLELTGSEAARIATGETADNEAYQAYLRGQYFLAKRTNEDFKRAIGYFEQAREHDPDYALAYAGLADSYFLLGGQFYGPDADYPPIDAIEEARESALEAVRLDENLAEPRATLGFIRFAYDWDWEGAEKDFLTAIDLDPNYAQAHHWYGVYLSMLDRHEEAIAQLEQAVALEPSSPLFNRALGTVYVRARRYDEAIQEFEAARELEPRFGYAEDGLMETYWVMGETEKAVAIAEDFDPDVGRVYRLAADGRFDEAQEALAALPAPLLERKIMLHLVVDDEDGFFDALEAWVENRERPVITVLDSPLLNPLRSHPRMIEVRERIGLPP